ncbi:MAG: hypothetical protein CMN28_00730 [Salinisphaeraceae bacterium]|jgi:hypothetical protein|nr:hypothetical protein [Salinisphaeraceae bacterium]
MMNNLLTLFGDPLVSVMSFLLGITLLGLVGAFMTLPEKTDKSHADGSASGHPGPGRARWRWLGLLIPPVTLIGLGLAGALHTTFAPQPASAAAKTRLIEKLPSCPTVRAQLRTALDDELLTREEHDVLMQACADQALAQAALDRPGQSDER